MLRIAVHHTDPHHADSAVFQHGEPFENRDDAVAHIEAAEAEYTPADGYVARLERLVTDNPEDLPEDQTSTWVEVTD